MRLSEIARLRPVREACLRRPDLALEALTCDSRRAGPQTAFYALAGAHTDGHRFLADALAAGARAVFVSEPAALARLREGEGPPAGSFLVDPGREALAEVSAAVYGAPSHRLPLLAVTGTNGKTTVSHLAAQLLEALGERCGLIGSLGLWLDGACHGTGLTTPEAPDTRAFLRTCADRGASAAAMEASSIGLAQGRTHGLRFRAAAFTNLSRDHLDHHPGMAAYREAKFDLFLRHEVARAVVNRDDPAGRELLRRLEAAGPAGAPAPLTFGLAGPATLTAEAVQRDADGMRGRLHYRSEGGDEAAPFATPLLGDYNLSNLLAAVGLLLAAGYPLADLAAGAARAPGAPGRFERVPVPRPFLVVVDYAHTPDALEKLLAAARPLARGRLWAVFGCGGERDPGKRPRMGAVAERLADRVVLTSDNPRGEPPERILADIRHGLRRPEAAASLVEREAAIGWTLARAEAGDVVVVAGKGHETEQEIAGRRLPFDDREVVRRWAARHG